jgi:PKD repeat protein
VTVVPQQMIPLISIDKQEVCPGETVTFSDASTPSATLFSWDFGDNDKSFVNNALHKFVNADTTYKVVYTARTECAIGEDSVYIKVSAIPTASFEVNDPVSCVNSPIIFSNTSTGDLISNTYWQYETNGSFDTTFNGLATYNSPGIRNITLFVEGKNSFCVNRANSTIEILDNPKPAFEVSRDSICLGSQIQLINLSKDATAFEWEFNNDRIVDFEPTYIPMEPGVYSIKLQAKQGNYCSDSLFDISAFTVLNCVVQVPEVFTPDGIPPGNEWNLVGDGIKEVQRLEIKTDTIKVFFLQKIVEQIFLIMFKVGMESTSIRGMNNQLGCI